MTLSHPAGCGAEAESLKNLLKIFEKAIEHCFILYDKNPFSHRTEEI